MEEIKSLLLQVLSNQVVIYKRLDEIERKKGTGFRSAPDKTYVEELKKEAVKYLPHIKQ